MRVSPVRVVALFLCVAGMGYAQTHVPPGEAPTVALISSKAGPGVVDVSLENEGRMALARALDWLAAKQNTNGCWSSDQYPAITALVLDGFLNSDHPRRTEVIPGAVKFILSCVQTNGGIYCDMPGHRGGGLSNYNTAICLAVLSELNDASMRDVLLRARAFLAHSQYVGNDVDRGGFGYDAATGRPHTDMMNTYYAVDAMSRTAGLEEYREGARVDLDWSAVTNYMAANQNGEASGPEQAGGFVYGPTEPKAGVDTNAAGAVVFRSYGSITYVGLMSLLHASVGPDDPRVKSAFHWAENHWTLEENPRMGSDGQYFFYDILSKCMSAYGRDTITKADGTTLAWREAMIRKLVSLQKIDAASGAGFWVNETNRFMEADPVLVTAYTVMAMHYALP